MNDHAGGQSMSGRVALVAGASRGIGAATAEAFAAAGAAVVLGARDMAALESVVKRIEAGGGRARGGPARVAGAGPSPGALQGAGTAVRRRGAGVHKAP